MRHPKRTRYIAAGLVFCMTTHANVLNLKNQGVVPLLFTLPASSKSPEPAPSVSPSPPLVHPMLPWAQFHPRVRVPGFFTSAVGVLKKNRNGSRNWRLSTSL
jgi:hypothetical protein